MQHSRSFISEEAVFISNGKSGRGKAAIAADWKKFYDAPRAPFSWKPDLVEVLAVGQRSPTRPVPFPIRTEKSSRGLTPRGASKRRESGALCSTAGSEVCNCPKP